MPLPQGFSEWEHLQSVLMQVHNRIVRDEFNDADDDDISTPRSSLKTACLLKDNDSILQTLLRYWLFYVDLRKAQDLQTPIYGIPIDGYQSEVAYKPQVKLFFKEDLDDIEPGYAPIRAEITFRLYDERYDTFSPSEAQSLATRIRSEFASGGGYRWHKGRLKVSYRRPEQGYQLIITAFSESEAREVIGKVIGLQGHSVDPDYLTISNRASNPPTVPPMEVIYGKNRRLPRKRPVGWVRFQYAELHLWGLPQPITLVDRTGYRANPLEVA
ncbi:MAG: hypothetical protein HC827_10020 [Cyanobacteria bacterium RM1_2_2]|nr:hypothetical protein [Cyanobacteria bacterium RM1_2_2]